MARFYVTTPIYYVNDVPHLGTAYTTVVADAVRRYHLLRGDESRMLTGTDEHGLRLERIAVERGLTPQAFVDEMSAPFRIAWPQLHVAADDFIRTTEPRHMAFARELWKKVEARGEIYEGHYEDWYCVGCESFKTEKELLPGNVCPLHLKPTEKVKERTFFFRLSKWQEPLLDLYRRRPDFIAPESRRNEVVSFVEAGLKDLSVSRTSFSWGIKVPHHEEHVMYVWFDALANYLSALKTGPDGKDRSEFWPPQGQAVHIVGKDILRFHAVYWPAFLLAAGYSEDELPSQIFAHGFLTVDGQKMSKTLRNAVDPLRLARELGADVVRYYLMRAVAFGQDGDFDHAALLERYNADLGKSLGNLLNRTLGLCAKLTGSKTPAAWEPTPLETELLDNARNVHATAALEAWDALAPHRALEATWAICHAANQYVDRAAPWVAAKQGDQARIDTILGTLLAVLEGLSVLLWPVMPQKADELRHQLGLAPLSTAPGVDAMALLFQRRAPHESLTAGTPLFPTLDTAAQAALLERLLPKPAPEASAVPAASAAPPAAPAPAEATPSDGAAPISYDTFAAVDLRVGIVVKAARVPKKTKLLDLEVDLGEPKPRRIVAGLALTFAPEALVGRRVVVVANLAPRDFGGGLVSHGMLLATGPSEALALATVPDGVAAGARLK